jgi:hypothetical protein
VAVPAKQLHNLNRGDAAMNRIKENEVPNIVHTYQIGRSTVHIASNYFAKTSEEVEKVLKEYHAAGWRIVDQVAASKE